MFDHFVITRFNINFPRLENGYNLQPHFIETRLDLLSRVCAPAFRQAVRNSLGVRWLIMCDAKTPIAAVNQLMHITREAEHIAVEDLPWKYVMRHHLQHMNVRSPRNHKWVLTTRLDSDDAMGPDFLKVLQTKAIDLCLNEQSAPVLLDFMEGYSLNTRTGEVAKASYEHAKDGVTQFASLLEKWDGGVPNGLHTVYHDNHMKMRNHYPVEQLPGRSWMRGIHGSNLNSAMAREMVDNPGEIVKHFGVRL